jgi:hypothetical protein
MSYRFKVGISASVSRKVSNTATRLAVQRAPKRTGLGAKGLYPIVKRGYVGVGIRPWASYMYFQEVGIKPFTMWSLEGKVIPMNIGGKTVFRTAVNVGKPGRINKRDPETGRIMKTNVGVKWRHPGLEPKNFIKDSLRDSIRIHRSLIKRDLMRQVKKEIERLMNVGD